MIEAQPVLKWAGGKRRQTQEILHLLPKEIDTYYEPFLGGAAVFFALQRQGRFKKAVLSDVNEELITFYRALRDMPGALILEARRMWSEYEVDGDAAYLRIRSDHNPYATTTRAARMLFLNKHCFNGLYRVNKKGRFNVPPGKFSSPPVLDEEGLLAASDALQGAELCVLSFHAVLGSTTLTEGDAVYFDPPYIPLKKDSFVAYDKSGFGMKEQERLRDTARALELRGVRVVISNSAARESYSTFAGFKFRSIMASRHINSDTGRRGKVKELLFYGGPA